MLNGMYSRRAAVVVPADALPDLSLHSDTAGKDRTSPQRPQQHFVTGGKKPCYKNLLAFLPPSSAP